MSAKISKQGKRELLEVLRQRYQRAAKHDKSKILDEFVAVARCHRKHAIRLLTANAPPAADTPVVARRTYDEAVRQALIVLWEAADRICGKRLKAVLPSLVAALERHGHLNLDAGVRQRVRAVSAATLDRLLASVRSKTSHRRKRRAATKSSKEVRIRTFADYGDPLPGYLEIDFVSHGGSSMEGVFLWSLVATDVCSGWTEAVALVAREQSLVVEGLEVIRRQFPVPIKGIDSDNDSAFINETLLAYCQQQKWEFTRSRAYQKNDQAWIEQKNGAVVRRFVGYQRHSGVAAGQCLARLYQSVRLFVNYFQPSMKLRSKTRAGAKVKKIYHKPATPCERLLGHASVAEAAKEGLRAEQGRLDPLDLLHRIRDSQAALAALSSGELGGGQERESIEQFLAALPDLWRQGEARPTHRERAPQPRAWRTRKDPFEKVWPQILLWLQEDPDARGKSLLDRLDKEHPGRFPEGQLRTLQRRVRDWRRVMARNLVHGCHEGQATAETPIVVGANAKD
ncbi:MAG TPA: transposase family protein [Gemmataceae bacterium]|nr:transposase family protein [Gemmataceae bacterium]